MRSRTIILGLAGALVLGGGLAVYALAKGQHEGQADPRDVSDDPPPVIEREITSGPEGYMKASALEQMGDEHAADDDMEAAREQWRLARAAFEEVAENYPDYQQRWAILGSLATLSLKLEDEEAAIEWANRAIEAKDTLVDVHLFLANLHLEREEYDELERHLVEVERKDPDHAANLRLRALLAERQGDDERALELTEDYIAKMWQGGRDVAQRRHQVEGDAYWRRLQAVEDDPLEAALRGVNHYLEVTTDDLHRGAMYYMEKYFQIAADVGDPEEGRYERLRAMYDEFVEDANTALAGLGPDAVIRDIDGGVFGFGSHAFGEAPVGGTDEDFRDRPDLPDGDEGD